MAIIFIPIKIFQSIIVICNQNLLKKGKGHLWIWRRNPEESLIAVFYISCY